MSGSILSPYRWQMFFNGIPASGALLYSYQSGSSTPYPLYSDSALSVPLTNPVVADSNGVFPIMYMAAVAYRIVVTTSDGQTIFPAQDNISNLFQLAQASINSQLASVGFGAVQGRLTLTSGLPVTVSDVTAATGVFFAPLNGNRIGLYSSGSWSTLTFAQLSIAVPATTSTLYDVFAYNNSGVVALELSAAWSASTGGASSRFASGTYATTLPTQDGIYVKSTDGTLIDATRRYLGTFMTTGVSGQTEDSVKKRLLWNYYNQVSSQQIVVEATASWTYTTAAYRQANGAAGNQLAFVVGVAQSKYRAVIGVQAVNTGANPPISVAVGNNSTSVAASPQIINVAFGITTVLPITCEYVTVPAVGYNVFVWLESSGTGSTTTWASSSQAGIAGEFFR